ncbi:MAG TPA: hypothetical protein VKB76_03810 [Ktedonobacterales bacterium]|nr:hypothetical protein [Ktedonobacterales bacterium]
MIHLTLALSAPPSLAIPSPLDAGEGWAVGIAVLIAPSLWLAFRSHSILGHWLRYFAQWHRSAWWIAFSGSVAMAAGTFTLLAALPIWQQRWDAWYLDAQTRVASNLNPLIWLNNTQAQLAQLLSGGSVVLIVVGVIMSAVGIWRYHKTILMRRAPVAATTEWMMAPNASRAGQAPPSTRQTGKFLN